MEDSLIFRFEFGKLVYRTGMRVFRSRKLNLVGVFLATYLRNSISHKFLHFAFLDHPIFTYINLGCPFYLQLECRDSLFWAHTALQ
jgi:hypothetical protein